MGTLFVQRRLRSRSALVGLMAVGAIMLLGACSSDEPVPVTTAATVEVATSEVPTSLAVDTSVGESTAAPAAPTSATSTSATSATSPTSVAGAGGIVLTADGLGIVKLGDPASMVIETLTAPLGAPVKDSGWYDEQIGCDIGEQLRDVQWPGLLIELSSGPSRRGPTGTQHLLAYFYVLDTENGAIVKLSTDKGITLGDTVAKLRAAYPDMTLLNSEIEGPVFEISSGCTGNLSALDDTGTIQSIRSGEICID